MEKQLVRTFTARDPGSGEKVVIEEWQAYREIRTRSGAEKRLTLAMEYLSAGGPVNRLRKGEYLSASDGRVYLDDEAASNPPSGIPRARRGNPDRKTEASARRRAS